MYLTWHDIGLWKTKCEVRKDTRSKTKCKWLREGVMLSKGSKNNWVSEVIKVNKT